MVPSSDEDLVDDLRAESLRRDAEVRPAADRESLLAQACRICSRCLGDDWRRFNRLLYPMKLAPPPGRRKE